MKALLLIAVGVGPMLGCSVLFEAASSDNPDRDGGGGDGDIGAPDAPAVTPLSGCDITYDDTISLYTMDSSSNSNAEDSVGNRHGRIFRYEEPPVSVVQSSRTGPAGCDTAISFPSVSIDSDDNDVLSEMVYIDIAPASVFQIQALSFDAWFYPPPLRDPSNPRENFGIVSKDAGGSLAGHVTISYRETATEGMILVARMQSTGDDDASFILCSDALETDRWHHFAFSLGGGQDAELFLDGKSANNTTTVLNPENQYTCGDKIGGVNPKQDLSENIEHLLLGASNSSSESGTTDNVVAPFAAGAIDHFRIRSGRFTLEEAFNVYRAVEL